MRIAGRHNVIVLVAVAMHSSVIVGILSSPVQQQWIRQSLRPQQRLCNCSKVIMQPESPVVNAAILFSAARFQVGRRKEGVQREQCCPVSAAAM